MQRPYARMMVKVERDQIPMMSPGKRQGNRDLRSWRRGSQREGVRIMPSRSGAWAAKSLAPLIRGRVFAHRIMVAWTIVVDDVAVILW